MNNSEKCKRASVTYSNRCGTFELRNRDYSHQYAHLYAERLSKLSPAITQKAKEKWGNSVPVKKLCEVVANEECIVIGTLYKHMDLKPTILKKLAAEEQLLPALVRQKFTDADDKLVLEDEMQRIMLDGEISVEELVTGIIIGVRGYENDDGKFTVIDHCFHGLLEQPPARDFDEDRYVLLVSGISMGSTESAAHLLSQELLVDAVCGELGTDTFQRHLAASLVRVIIAGNSLSKHTQNKELGTKAKYLMKNVKASSVEAMKDLDHLLERLVSSVPVDIMPGAYDPSNCMLPQQPLHRCMFPKSSLYTSTFNCVTNPYEADIGQIRFLGTSGQPLDDIFRYSAQSKPIDMLHFLLSCAHLAPTAPDTLSCYPYYDHDPFIMSSSPHVFFAGNQQEFACKKITDERGGARVLLVCVPKFSVSGSVVVVNLRTLQCEPLHISTTLSH